VVVVAVFVGAVTVSTAVVEEVLAVDEVLPDDDEVLPLLPHPASTDVSSTIVRAAGKVAL
jgi:hypothetical protein